MVRIEDVQTTVRHSKSRPPQNYLRHPLMRELELAAVKRILTESDDGLPNILPSAKVIPLSTIKRKLSEFIDWSEFYTHGEKVERIGEVVLLCIDEGILAHVSSVEVKRALGAGVHGSHLRVNNLDRLAELMKEKAAFLLNYHVIAPQMTPTNPCLPQPDPSSWSKPDA